MGKSKRTSIETAVLTFKIVYGIFSALIIAGALVSGLILAAMIQSLILILLFKINKLSDLFKFDNASIVVVLCWLNFFTHRDVTSLQACVVYLIICAYAIYDKKRTEQGC